MLFGKTERKRHSAKFVLAVGALAAVGAISLVKSGKQMFNDACGKIKLFSKKNECSCPIDKDE